MREKKFKGQKEIYDFWEKGKFFKANLDLSKKSFSLLIPPPNLTGELHLGHAMQHAILDALARFKRLQGFDVLLLPGVDHAGIQFEATFNGELKKQNLSKEKLGREKWLERAWKFKNGIYKSVSANWRMMGLSADWSREVFTLDPGPQKAVFEEFKAYFEKGLIYKGPYIVQWCPKCNTAIEDVEVEYKERKEKLYYVKYPIAEDPRTGRSGKEFIVIATARPETIFADVAIAVHPESKHKKYIGRTAYHPPPLTPNGRQNQIKIIGDKRVEKDFGTGALKITPGHDTLDYQIGQDNELPIYHAIDKSGRMTKLAGDLHGLGVHEAREKAADLLNKGGYVEKVELYTHSLPVCERCKTTIEPLISDEWFVKVKEMADEAIKVIKAGKINFLPKNYAKILANWLANIHDWCISRSLWWGQRIPVWYRGNPSTSSGPDGMKVSDVSPGPGWKQDEQVLDTWFSSGLWPISTLGWPFDSAQGKPLSEKPRLDPQLAKYFPWDFEISAPEIKYLWIARMIMISNYFTGEIPFKTMFFHGMLRDLQGRKFSKSLGNGIEPTYLIDRWGVDATRMALYTYSIPGRDGRVSREILDERGKNFRNFATKIRNIARFIYELKPGELRSSFNHLHPGNIDDAKIMKKLGETIRKVTKNMNNLELHLAVEEIYDFIWHELADKYIEQSKKRREEAQPVLEIIFDASIRLLHPFMPFLTEELYQKYIHNKKSIMLERWPSFVKAPYSKSK